MILQEKINELGVKSLAQWMFLERKKQGLSNDYIAEKITSLGYKISQHKLLRIEQNLKNKPVRPVPIEYIDLDLVVNLEEYWARLF